MPVRMVQSRRTARRPKRSAVRQTKRQAAASVPTSTKWEEKKWGRWGARLRVKQWRMPEPMNLRESGVREGAASGTPPPLPPLPACSRCETKDDAVLPDDPGAEDLADGVVPGLRGPLRQGLQLCRDSGTRVPAGTVPPPPAPQVWGGGPAAALLSAAPATHLRGGCPGGRSCRRRSRCFRPAPAGSSWPSPAAAWPAASVATPAAAPGTWGTSVGVTGLPGGLDPLQHCSSPPPTTPFSWLQSNAAQKPSTSNLSKHLLGVGGPPPTPAGEPRPAFDPHRGPGRGVPGWVLPWRSLGTAGCQPWGTAQPPSRTQPPQPGGGVLTTSRQPAEPGSW